jgi:hypothetical protein
MESEPASSARLSRGIAFPTRRAYAAPFSPSRRNSPGSELWEVGAAGAGTVRLRREPPRGRAVPGTFPLAAGPPAGGTAPPSLARTDCPKSESGSAGARRACRSRVGPGREPRRGTRDGRKDRRSCRECAGCSSRPRRTAAPGGPARGPAGGREARLAHPPPAVDDDQSALPGVGHPTQPRELVLAVEEFHYAKQHNAERHNVKAPEELCGRLPG